MLNFFKLAILLALLGFKPQKPHHKHKLTIEEEMILERKHKRSDDICIGIKGNPISFLLKKYPFNKSSKIIAVSYPLQLPKRHPSETSLDLIKNALTSTEIKERAILNKQQISSLLHILYQTDFKNKNHGPNTVEEGKCFEPRNAILFYDGKGRVFDYIEICFQCKNSESHSDKIAVGTPCRQKYDLLKKWFLSLGIKYGTIEGIEH